MANSRSRLLYHLAEAQEALADAEVIITDLLDDSDLMAEAREYAAAIRDNVARLEALLDSVK
jgi:predicted AAA+ superfamily ATPase